MKVGADKWMTNRYDTVQLVRPWILKWQAPLQAQAEESCQNGGVGYEGFETWRFISWTFGDEAVFLFIDSSLLLMSTVIIVGSENRLVNAQGTVVGDIMPVGSVGQ